jgi:hypothetical protein
VFVVWSFCKKITIEMNVVESIHKMLDENRDEELIPFCVGSDSFLSIEVAKNTMGASNTRLRKHMSFLRRGLAPFGRFGETKDLTNIEHVNTVKGLVNFVLKFLAMDSPSPQTQEQALDNHGDIMESSSRIHDRLDNIEKMLDPTETASMVMSMPSETRSQVHEKIKAMRKTKNELNAYIAEHKQGTQIFLAEERRVAAKKTLQLAESVSDSVDYVLSDITTIDECQSYIDRQRATIKLAVIKRSQIKKDEKIIGYCFSFTM